MKTLAGLILFLSLMFESLNAIFMILDFRNFIMLLISFAVNLFSHDLTFHLIFIVVVYVWVNVENHYRTLRPELW